MSASVSLKDRGTHSRSVQLQTKEKTMSEYPQSQGISTTTQCYNCLQLDDICDTCMEEKEANDALIAHQLIDESSDIYRYTPMYTSLMKITTEPSNHDWTDRDGEFMEPIVKLQDGLDPDLAIGLSSVEMLEDYAQSKREQKCLWCHLLTPKMYNDCQACDKPLEHNVISNSLKKEISRFLN
jgi:hypothetical protein